MAKKGGNEAIVMIGALVITAGLIGAGVWLLTGQGNVNIGDVIPNSDSSSNPGTPNLPDNAQTAGTLSEVQNVPNGLFSYGGSTTWAPIRGSIDPILQSTYPGFQLRYLDPVGSAPSSGAGIQMLLDNQLAFSQSSRAPSPEEMQAAQQLGFTLQAIPVALEGIAVAVHPNLNVPGLTMEQLKGIYTGQITDWSQVGGPSLPITAYSRAADGGTVEFFVSNVLTGQSFGTNVQMISTTTEALRAVSNDPGGIYYASAPEVIGQCTTKPLPIGRAANALVAPYVQPLIPPSQCPAQRNQIDGAVMQSGQYPITRSLFVIVRQDGQLNQQAGEAYANLLLTSEAQGLLATEGFVPLR